MARSRWSQCIDGNCRLESLACFHGDADCRETLQCIEGCAGRLDVQACGSSCLANGTDEAQSQYQALIECAAAQCGEMPGQECQQQVIRDMCSMQYHACVGG